MSSDAVGTARADGARGAVGADATDAATSAEDVAEDVAEDLAAVLGSLLDDLRFSEVGEAVRSVDALRGPQRRRVIALCRAGGQLLALDAADFADVEGIPPELVAQVRAMQFPQTPLGEPRGSLQSLHPLLALMLEALAIYWERDEMVYVMLIVHLVGEYLPMVAWEPVLGHSGDPLRLRVQVAGTLWATPQCAMPRHRRSAAERVVALDPHSGSGGIHPEQWRVYLDKWHSRVAGGLRQCALRPGDGRPNPEDAGCDLPCGVVTRLGQAVLTDLARRMALGAAFSDSPLVTLRHSAPVGHFFGVPQRSEVLAAWEETRTWLCRPWAGPGEGGGNPVAAGLPAADGEPLPGLQALLSVVAGRDVTPGGLLARLGDEIRGVLAPLLQAA